MKSIIITGSHRSGTSLTASILARAGVNLGRQLIGAAVSNPKGHFENVRFVLLNDEILAAAGGDWRHPPSGSDLQSVAPRFTRKIADLVAEEASELWGAKDPRFCFTYPLYLPHLTNPHFIICRRDVQGVVGSLKRRTEVDVYHANLPIEDPDEFVASHYRSIEPVSLNHPTFDCKFEEYFANPEKLISDMMEFVGVESSAGALAQIVDSSLNHSR